MTNLTRNFSAHAGGRNFQMGRGGGHKQIHHAGALLSAAGRTFGKKRGEVTNDDLLAVDRKEKAAP